MIEKFPPRIYFKLETEDYYVQNSAGRVILAQNFDEVWPCENNVELYVSAKEHEHLIEEKELDYQALSRMHAALAAENARLKEAVNLLLPIVEEAFWDHHSAGMLPGTGYHHNVYRKVSATFGWRDTTKWVAFKKALTTAPKQGEEEA